MGTDKGHWQGSLSRLGSQVSWCDMVYTAVSVAGTMVIAYSNLSPLLPTHPIPKFSPSKDQRESGGREGDYEVVEQPAR